MAILKEFKDFINRGNVVDLAVAVVIGGAFGKIVTALVSDLVMPLVNAVVPQGDWRKWEVTPLHFRIGDLFGTAVDFLVVAFVVFVVMVKVVGAAQRRGAKPAAAPATKACPECLENVPVAARRCRACTSVLVALFVLVTATAANAQTDPKFAFGKPEAAPGPAAVEWKAQAKGGVSMTTGNSQNTNATASFTASRKQAGNRVSLDGALIYGQNKVIVPVVDTATNTITALDSRTVETANSWIVKGRYDRFLTTNNTVFGAAQAAADKVAGKSLIGGGQVGYMRQLYTSDMHLVVAEIGYDFSYESYVQQPGKTIEPVSIHSVRAFVGETLKLSAATGITAGLEALSNVNKETKAIDAKTGMLGVDPFADTRLTGKLGLTTTLWKSLSAGFGFTLRYDQNPAPRPIPSGSPAGASYAPGFQPFADKVDTLTEATLIYTFL